MTKYHRSSGLENSTERKVTGHSIDNTLDILATRARIERSGRRRREGDSAGYGVRDGEHRVGGDRRNERLDCVHEKIRQHTAQV